MLGMETVAERMADYLIGHHPAMPGVCKAVQALVATRCLEHGTHTFHNDSLPCPMPIDLSRMISKRSGKRKRNVIYLRTFPYKNVWDEAPPPSPISFGIIRALEQEQ